TSEESRGSSKMKRCVRPLLAWTHCSPRSLLRDEARSESALLAFGHRRLGGTPATEQVIDCEASGTGEDEPDRNHSQRQRVFDAGRQTEYSPMDLDNGDSHCRCDKDGCESGCQPDHQQNSAPELRDRGGIAPDLGR